MYKVTHRSVGGVNWLRISYALLGVNDLPTIDVFTYLGVNFKRGLNLYNDC